ncbi:InlB B-repeat-containing protein [Gardnerella swidsinskii]|nr:InlB B-repeat-containing protein [Gardnerella swidsinskii]
MAERKDLYGDMAPRRTLRKAHAVKRSRALRKGVAGVAVASTLAMMLPSVVASALQPTQKDIIDASNTTQKWAKVKPDVDELNMQRWGAGVLNKGAQIQKFVELARHDARMQKLREAQQREIEQREINKSEAKQRESQQHEVQQRDGIDSQLGSSSEQVNFGHSYAVSAPAPVQPVHPAVKPESTPTLKPTAKPESTSTAKQDAKQPAETKQPEAKQPEENAGDVKPAEVKPGENKQPAQPANTQPVNTESAKPANEQNTSEQPSSTHAENTNAASDANTPRVRVRRSVESGDGASDGNSVTTTTSAPATSTAPSANNASAAPTANTVDNTTAPSAPAPSTGTASNAGAGTTAKPSTENTTAQGANANVSGEEKSTTPASNNEHPSPASTSNAGTTTNNAATDPNSQVIKSNEQHPTAENTEQANEQVQTDKKPKATYNLKIRYTIGGAANKQLVQPYELTIDQEDFDNLGKDGKYEYIELPKAAGYRPSVYHSGDYQYYIKNSEDKFVIDDGTDADAKRYLRLSKKLITDYAVKKRQAVESNNSAQSSQNPSSTQSGSDDGIQYYGELNINYAPKTAKYYVRHLVQDLDHKDEFHDAPNLGVGKTIEVTYKDGKKERIHVTEVTGTVGSDVSAVALYIPGYEPEHNLISSPLSDSEDEKDKLVLNLRYYRKAYEVTYDSAGGTDVTAQKVYYQQDVPQVTKPTRRGYTFKGWSLVDPSKESDPLYAENTIVSLDDYKMPDHNVQFRANWEANNTTSYRVNVWVQKADLVDKEHPDSLANYDFVGLVERKNVQTDSDVALDNMDDAGVIKDANALNGTSADDYVSAPELGLTKEELQGKDSDHKTGLISKFNWMNDTPVTSLGEYDTKNPGDAKNKGKDLFTRYFHVNKDLTKKLNSAEYDLVPDRPDLGKRSKSQLCANDLNNTLNLVYDRNTYELIFAKPAGIKNDSLNNAAIKRKDENGKTTIYCYAGGGNCSDEYDDKNEDDSGNAINHKGYRVNVRYGQRLTDIWPDVNELDFNKENTGSLGWTLGYAGDDRRCYRDTPPYRFTKKEFADPSLRVDLKNGTGIAPRISDDPSNPNEQQYELKDNQRLLTADISSKSAPIQVIIRKQSIASAKNGGDDIGDNDYELSTDSYSKDDTDNSGYLYTAPSIAGFNPADGYDKTKVGDSLDPFDFEDNREEWYNESHGHGNWDDLSDDEKNAFAKKYHLAFRKYRGVPVDEQEDYSGDATEFETNKLLEFRYNRKSYDVQFYNTSKQFDGKYTFTLNNKTYSIVRPADLPEDYVFKGWAVDQAGTQFINGENKDITMPVNGIKLYAAWGLPTDIQHTVTFDYHMPKTDDNGNEISGSDVVTEKKFPRYHVIDEKKISTPTRKGYDFYGWEIKKNGTTLPYAFGNKVVEDIKLDAVWVKDTRYNGTFKHIFLKPGVTFADYKKEGLSDAEKAAMVDHVSTQTVSGLREHLRYNAEAVYSDETHFPDKQFTSFEASSDEKQNTGEFIYQTYNTRKYKVKYIDQNGKELLPESEVSSVNRKYDVVFYKPIEGFMPESTQQNITYTTDSEGKQTREDTFIFKYKDVRVLKRNDDKQARPDHYTRYVFKVADGQDSMGSVVDWQNKDVADGSVLVYDAIKGTKAYQMPLPTVKAKPGFEFVGWTSKVGSSEVGSHTLQYSDGVNRLPIRSEEQNNPEVIYTAHFKLKAPIAAAPQVLTPLENISTGSSDDAKKLITNSYEYPTGATFSFAPGEKFDNTPGLHKIKVQVHLGNNIAEAEVLYRVLPDLVYASEWDKFKATDYGKAHIDEYAPITFTGKNDEGTIIGHDGDNANHPAGEKTTLTAYVYKGKEVRIRVPQAFGNDYSDQHYHYVFKGWATNVVKPTAENPKQEQTFDINSSDRYKKVNLQDGVTYHAIYKRIDYFSSSSDNGTVPEDSVVAIFKPAPGRKWKDGTDGPKVFYVKKGTDLSQIPYSASDQTSALTRLQENLTNAKGTWNRSSMINGKEEVTPIDDVSNWKVDKPFQEFVADQTPWTEPAVQTDYLVAVQDKPDTLPKLTDFITNMSQLKADAAVNNGIEDIKVEYDLPTEAEQNKLKQKMLKKPALYTVPLKVTVKYKDAADYKTYRLVGRLKVLYQLMYDKSLPKPDSTQPSHQPGDTNPLTGVAAERDLVLNKDKYVKVNFINANQVDHKDQGSLDKDTTKLYYVLKDDVTGVKAPQAVGKDYDADGYHYVFKGWRKLENFVDNDNSDARSRARRSLANQPEIPVTTLMVSEPASATSVDVQNANGEKLLSNDEIRKLKYSENTTYQAVYEKVMNIIDAKSNEKVPDNYVPYVFLPAFGRKWDDGSYKPKVIYFKSDSTKYDDDVAGKTNELKNRLKGFSKWEVYDAGNKPVPENDTNDNRQIRVYVANQIADMPVNVSQFVKSVGDEVPAPDELVSGVDPNNLEIAGMHGAGVVYSSGANSVRIAKPGITTVRVKVETSDPNKKGAKIVRYENVPIQVLPNVIAERDLPSAGSQAGKFILENYTKVTYVAGNGGTMQSPMHTYWVRKDRMSEIKNYIPDVLANKGYIFKNWDEVSYSKHIDTIYNSADNHKSTDIERETLAKIAERYGMSFTANVIRKSKNSTFAAIKNILAEAINNENMSYEASRNRLAIVAETLGKSYTAKIIRNSQHSTIEALKNLLVQAGITDADIAMVFPESETIITANFEKMAPMKFKFSGSAREGVLTNFRLQNMTEGDVNNTTVTVDGKKVTINELVAQGLTSVNGINANCAGTECKISGTPKIVDGKPKVELTFTTTDKYGREAEITVEIDVISESKPAPTPERAIPSLDSYTSYDVTIENEKKQEKDVKETAGAKPELAKTGSNTVSSASAGILSAAIAAIGLAVVKTGKHHRKRRNNK